MSSNKRELIFRSAQLVLLATAASVSIHCGGSEPTDGTGRVAMQLMLPDGSDVQEVTYRIAGPTQLSGTVDVSKSATVSATLGPLAAGNGYTLKMTATSNGGPCAGSAGPFAITPGAVTPVSIVLTCPSLHGAGQVAVDGKLSVCPGIDAIVASPSEVHVGADIQLTAIAGPDDSVHGFPLVYSWTGVSSSDARGKATFHCDNPGKYVVSLAVSNGVAACSGPDAAAPTSSVTVSCTEGGQTADAAPPGDTDASSDTDGSSDTDASTSTDAAIVVDASAPAVDANEPADAGVSADVTEIGDATADAPADVAPEAGPRVNLAKGMPTTADSQQTSKSNLAVNATDDNVATRWSASDAALNHWLSVDLGSITALTGTEVLWEGANAYGYKIEVSTDAANWTLVVGPKTSGGQLDADAFVATARYVRLTVTALPYHVWASAWEFRAFGQ